MSRELSDGRPGGGQEDRLLVYFLPYFIHLIFISSHASPPSFHCLSSFSPTNSAAADSSSALSSAACVRDREDSNHGVQGTAGGSHNFLLGSAGGRIEEARAADSSSALSSAACVRDSEDSSHGVQGTAGGSHNFLLGSAGGRIEEARAADFLSLRLSNTIT
jgi:hypothetical protein